MKDLHKLIEELKQEIPELREVPNEEIIAFIRDAIAAAALRKPAE